jgi:hypothetical protein
MDRGRRQRVRAGGCGGHGRWCGGPGRRRGGHRGRERRRNWVLSERPVIRCSMPAVGTEGPLRLIAAATCAAHMSVGGLATNFAETAAGRRGVGVASH